MGANKTYAPGQLLIWLALLVVALFLIGFVHRSERVAFVSSEIAFTDPSASGLAIMPASCASDPSYYHGSLSATADGLGYVSADAQTEYGASRNSVFVCVTNTTGASYFVPANTASEMNTLKSTRGGWAHCANENATCSFSGTRWVLYGVNDDWRLGQYTNGVACTNAALGGDPAPGLGKRATRRR
jgi:hypothetical protein